MGINFKVKCSEPCRFDVILNFHSVPVVTSRVGTDGTKN